MEHILMKETMFLEVNDLLADTNPGFPKKNLLQDTALIMQRPGVPQA